ncbi:hypothetical protein N9N28_05025 [Rubripirellula amarantea]|nr:hypothetical protein [Rubripirellula amarantea]
MKLPAEIPIEATVDSRVQAPLNLHSLVTEFGTLATGDYLRKESHRGRSPVVTIVSPKPAAVAE